MSGVRCALAVLARAPEPGCGKSRLRASLAGAPGGALDSLVGAMVADTLSRACAGDRPVAVCGCGDLERLAALAPTAHLVRQPDTGFGLRLEAAVDAGFDLPGVGGVLLIGTDSPTLPGRLLDAAEAALERSDCALVGADDGGWVALATRTRLHGVLTAPLVRWSTRHAAADTVTALAAADRSVAALAPWYDIDDAAGLRRLATDGPATARRAPRTLAALAAVLPTAASLRPQA